jgi:hypothetical protein
MPGRAKGKLDGHDPIEVIEHQMELEAEEPAHAGLAPRRQAREGFVPADAAVVPTASAVESLCS